MSVDPRFGGGRFPPTSYSNNAAGGGGSDPWTGVFGPRPIDQGDPTQDRAVTIWDMPEAYRRGNNILPDILVGLVGMQQEWTYSNALPLKRTDQIKVEWTTIAFDQPLAGMVPHQATSRLIRSSRSSKSANSIRRGLALEMEMDYVTTAEGAQMLLNHLLQMKFCIIKTIAVEVMCALRQSNDNMQLWERKYGVRRHSRLDRIKAEIMEVGEFAHDWAGIERFDDRVHQLAQQNNVRLNMWIVGPEFRQVEALMHAERQWYYTAGSRGVARWLEGQRSMGTIKGLQAFQAPVDDPYSRIDDGYFPHMRTRVTTGQYFPMADELRESGDQRKRRADDRSIIINSDDAGGAVKITMLQALQNCGRFGPDGKLHEKHAEVMRHSDADDMHFYATSSGREVCHFLGQQEPRFFNALGFRNMVVSGGSRLSDEERADVAYIVNMQQTLRSAALGPDEDGGYTYGTDGSAMSVRDVLDTLAVAYVNNHAAVGQLASWAGIEAVARAGDVRAQRGLAAAFKLWNSLVRAYGGDHNPLLNPNYCPRYLYDVVDQQNRGVATLFERGVFSHTAPLVVGAGVCIALMCTSANHAGQQVGQPGTDFDTTGTVLPNANDADWHAPRLPHVGWNTTRAANLSAPGGAGMGADAARGALPVPVRSGERLEHKRQAAESEDASAEIQIDEELADLMDNSPALLERYNAVMSTRDGVDRAVGSALIFARCDYHTYKSFIECDFSAIPYTFRVFRPRVTYDMGSVILMQGGPDTGETYYGHDHMGQSTSVTHKTIFFHFTFYCRAIVYHSENIYLCDGKYYRAYVGGCGHEFGDEQWMDDWAMHDFHPPNENVRNSPSLIAVMGPYSEYESKTPAIVDIRGFFEEDVQSPVQGAEAYDDNVCHYSSMHFTNARWRFDGMRPQFYGLRLLDTRENPPPNSVCVVDWYKSMGPTGDFTNEHLGQGHHGQRPVGGHRMRDGAMVCATKLGEMKLLSS